MYKLALIVLLFPAMLFAEEFLAPLKKNQKINLISKDTYYEILILKDGLDTITEVGKDYIVVEDALKAKEIRIPIYRIKNITKINP